MACSRIAGSSWTCSPGTSPVAVRRGLRGLNSVSVRAETNAAAYRLLVELEGQMEFLSPFVASNARILDAVVMLCSPWFPFCLRALTLLDCALSTENVKQLLVRGQSLSLALAPFSAFQRLAVTQDEKRVVASLFQTLLSACGSLPLREHRLAATGLAIFIVLDRTTSWASNGLPPNTGEVFTRQLVEKLAAGGWHTNISVGFGAIAGGKGTALSDVCHAPCSIEKLQTELDKSLAQGIPSSPEWPEALPISTAVLSACEATDIFADKSVFPVVVVVTPCKDSSSLADKNKLFAHVGDVYSIVPLPLGANPALRSDYCSSSPSLSFVLAADMSSEGIAGTASNIATELVRGSPENLRSFLAGAFIEIDARTTAYETECMRVPEHSHVWANDRGERCKAPTYNEMTCYVGSVCRDQARASSVLAPGRAALSDFTLTDLISQISRIGGRIQQATANRSRLGSHTHAIRVFSKTKVQEENQVSFFVNWNIAGLRDPDGNKDTLEFVQTFANAELVAALEPVAAQATVLDASSRLTNFMSVLERLSKLARHVPQHSHWMDGFVKGKRGLKFNILPGKHYVGPACGNPATTDEEYAHAHTN